MSSLPGRVLIPLKISDRVKSRSYIHIDTRIGLVDVVRGWPIPAASEGKVEAMALLYSGTVGLLRTLLDLFPDQRAEVADYLRDVAAAIDDDTW